MSMVLVAPGRLYDLTAVSFAPGTQVGAQVAHSLHLFLKVLSLSMLIELEELSRNLQYLYHTISECFRVFQNLEHAQAI